MAERQTEEGLKSTVLDSTFRKIANTFFIHRQEEEKGSLGTEHD